MSRINPIILLVIVIVAFVFFVIGLVQLLVRCLMKRPSFSSISQSSGFPDAPGSQIFQRQLQQLFMMHDSGLDQAIVEALPVFHYKEIKGLKGPFDCAVCLCEFQDGDRLKLLVNCSHAFHIHCIDTWLLSNSTCPLCRGLIGSMAPIGNHLSNFDDSTLSCPFGGNEPVSFHMPGILPENACPAPSRIFSIRLGKFRSSNEGLESGDTNQNVGSSSSTIDARRCYSMGAFQYFIGDAELGVTLSGGDRDGLKAKGQCKNEQLAKNGEMDGKKINARSRGDSFSVSKIWLWSRKAKFPSSLDA